MRSSLRRLLIFTDVLPLSGAGTGAGIGVAGLTVLATTGYSVREARNAEKACHDDGAE